jgi:hypothetical protein
VSGEWRMDSIRYSQFATRMSQSERRKRSAAGGFCVFVLASHESVGSETPTDAIRILPGLTDPAAPGKRQAHIYRRSTTVLAPRSLSSQGTQPQARLPGTRPRSSLSGCYPPLPVQFSPARTAHPSRSARGMMPKAARARVASPPAGTALAPRSGTASRTASVRARFEKYM